MKDRPGHDRRYAMDARKIERELGWRPKETFDTGIRKTVRWYLENDEWVSEVTSGSYRDWIERTTLLELTSAAEIPCASKQHNRKESFWRAVRAHVSIR